MENIISKYVYTFISSKNENLIYCSRSNSFLKVSQRIFDFINECKNTPSLLKELDGNVLTLLKKNKIIVGVDDDKDYLLEHQVVTDQRTYSKSILGLTLVPTLACNFDCPYCFENNKRAKTMPEKVIDDLVSFINLHTEAQCIDLTWFGGEPLLAFHILKDILKRIDADVRIPLRGHSIITNGYYFNADVIEFFKHHSLKSIQITLDGQKERHDKIRKQKGTGQGSFDQLILNMDTILTELPTTKLSVRINIEKNNLQDFYILQDELSKRWEGKNVSIYPGILRIENETQTALSCSSLNSDEIDDLIFNLRSNNILNVPIYPQLNLNKNCCATLINSYIVGPRGEIYKCWNDVSDDNKIIGYINEEKLINPQLLHRYIIASKWYNNPECKECFALPICKGSCAWYRLRDIYNKGEYRMCNCLHKKPDILNKCLEQYYYTQKHKNTSTDR